MCVCPVALTREVCGKKYTQFVPCGQCEECMKDRQNEYVIRTYEEVQKRGNPWFITLTYAEENVPYVFDLIDGELLEDESYCIDKESGEVLENLRTINNRDLQLWKKRVVRNIEYHTGKKLDFGYLLCGEYGPRTHRPHYHGMLLGLTDEQVREFEKDWQENYGFTCFKKVNITEVDRVASYIAKYIVKMPELEDEYLKDGKVAKPRKITSVGYGMPTRKRFDMMRRDVLGEMISDMPDMDNLSGINPVRLDKEIKKIANNHKKKYKLNGREYKLPGYYWKRFTYVKDDLTGKVRATEISKMVSKALQDRVQTDFATKLIQMAYNNNLAENYEECVRASKIVCASEKEQRQERAKTIIETNIAALRKSRF